MANYIGSTQEVDHYIGGNLVAAKYIGENKYFDAYTEITGNLPLTFESRAQHALKNYRLYGDSDGSGVETGNLWDFTTQPLSGNGYLYNGSINLPAGTYTLRVDLISGNANMSCAVVNNQGTTVINATILNHSSRTFTSDYDMTQLRFYVSDTVDELYFTLVSGSTAPASYIPPGYKIPILCQSKIVTDNLFDKNATDTNNGYVDGYHLKNDGTTGSNSSWAISEYIPVTGGLNYTFNYGSVSSSPAICYYDSDKHFISGVPYGGQLPKAVSVPQNVSYIRFSFMKSYTDDIMFVQGDSLPDHYIPHFYQSNYDLFVGDTKLGAEEFLDYGEQKVYKRTENLFDKDAPRELKAYLTIDGTTQPATDDISTTDFIPVKPNTTYTITATGSKRIKGFYADKTVIRTDTYDDYYIDFTGGAFTTGQQTAYIRFSIQPEYVNTCMFVKGSTTPQTYIPYLQPTDPPAPLPAIQAYQGENTLSSTESVGDVTVKGRIRELQYRRVEYIKSNGDQYILTDIIGLNAYTDYIEAEMSFGELSRLNDGTCFFGCATIDSGHWTMFGVLGDSYDASANTRNNHFWFYPNYSTGGSGTIKRMSCSTNGDYSSKLLLSLKTPQATVVNTSTSATYVPTILDPSADATTLQPIDFTQLAKFCVFAGQYYRGEDDVRYYYCGREASCYGIRIYRNNTLLHSLIPVEREDGELGLLDEITGKFYTNAGTGTFVKGGYVDA